MHQLSVTQSVIILEIIKILELFNFEEFYKITLWLLKL